MKNISFIKIFSIALIFSLAIINLNAQISGKVFRDFNGNGIRDTWNGVQEPIIGNVVIKAYDNTGTLVGTTSSDDVNGSYTFTGLTGKIRLELELPEMEYDGAFASGGGSKSSVRFVNATLNPANINFALSSPDEYFVSTNPKVFTIRYCNGNMNSGSQSGNTDIVLAFNYQDTGIPASQGGGGPEPQHIASGSSVGSVWGTAYSKQANKLFVSAFLKRHVGMGPGGPGAVYMLDVASPPAAGVVPPYASLDVMGYPTQGSGSYTATPIGFHPVIGTNAQRGLPDGGPVPSADASAFGQVGKVSLGDLDISADGKYLFTVNLYDRKIYRIDLGDPKNPSISNSSTLKTYSSLPWLTLDNANGKARPFALRYYKGYIYVGVVTTEENLPYSGSSALKRDPKAMRAFIYKIDPEGNGSGTIALEFPLNYTKETASTGDGAVEHGWYTWSDNFNDFFNPGYVSWSTKFPGHNQPILSDIEFDHEGSMMLALMDRSGHQWGVANYTPAGDGSKSVICAGDILRTYFDKSSNTFTLEANGIAGPYNSGSVAGTSGTIDINTGPGTPNGTGASFTGYTTIGREFFYMDCALLFGSTYPNPHHNEGINGGVALFGPSGQVLCTGLDPVDNYAWSGGVYKLSTSDGSRTNGYNLFTSSGPGNYGGFLGKANGMGDVEVMNEIPPIEIGNLVWEDTDKDGIQDPEESGIPGVTVQLLKNGTVIASAITDANGNYIFSSGPGTSTSSLIYGISGLEPNMAYVIRVPVTVNSLVLTTADAGSRNTIDSDAPANGDITVLSTEIPENGANNHTFDIGYYSAPCTITDAGKSNVACNNAGTGSDPTDDYVTFSLNPTGSQLGTTYTVSVNNGGTVTPTSGTYGSVINFRLQNGSATGAVYTVTITDGSNNTCKITTTVSANSCSADCSLLDGGICAINCSNTGADGNGSNDYIMFDLNPTGLNLGGTYNVTVSSGTVTKANGSPATGIAYGTSASFRLQDGSAGAGNIQVTVTDASNPACKITFTLDDPGACSGTNCADAYMLNPGESFTATVQSTDIVVSTIQWFKSTNGGVTFTPIPAPAGTAQNLTINAVGHYYYTANGLDGCKDSLCCHLIVIPANCFECQLLNPGKSNLNCNNNSTPTNPNDDYITFTLNPQGSLLGSSYTVSVNNGGTITPSTGIYGTPSNFRLQNGSANGTVYTITITDSADPDCKITTTVQMQNCGVECEITNVTIQNIECHNNNTNGNTNDDHLTFEMTVSGNYVGTTYFVSASSGTISPTTGTYNTINTFTLNSGSAGGGDIIITVIDANDPACTLQSTVHDPGNCSVCDLGVNAGPDQSICLGECTTLTAQANGGSGIYSYHWSNGASGASIQVCPTVTTTYSVTVSDNLGCVAIDIVEISAQPCPFDLALKLTTPRDLPVKPGDVVPFVITVCNQSDITVESYEITDYIPAGLSLADPTWTAGTDGHSGVSASKTFPGPLVGGECIDHTIYLIVNPGATRDDFVNYAEITDAIDQYGHSDDVDSEPGTDAAHELAVGCGDPDDDNMNGRGPNGIPVPGDEDDHDPACLPFFDLALTKIEKSTGPYKYGDNVTFSMTITNQGNVTAKNIRITDYVPDGFEYVFTDNPLWIQNSTNTPSVVLSNVTLAPDETTTVELKLKLKSTANWQEGWINRAEISRVENEAGIDISNHDYDSWEDPIEGNDAGGNPDTASDNVIDGDGTGLPDDTNPATDEDDEDPARVKVYDLALTKKLMTPEPYEYYQDMTFEIEVFNQGNEIMKDVVVSDYIPAGYTFNSGLNPGWSGTAPTVSRTIAQINPGVSVKIPLVLKLVQSTGGLLVWDNYAEITSAKDKDGVNANTWDSDSNPGSDSAHERAVKPNDADDNNINGHYIPDGTDEDDHDPAGPKVFDLALKKVETSTGAYRYGDQVTFTYTVYNQGNTPAKSIEVGDYVPSGFAYDPALNPTWTQSVVPMPKTILTQTLAPGASVDITMKLILQASTDTENAWTNRAEVIYAEDPQGNNMSNKDIDSQLDSSPNNDTGGTPDTPEDNMVTDDGQDGDGDGVTDEDDADPARVKVYDLALTKKLLTPEPYTYYQDHTFEIEVFNQGNEIMKDVIISDYIPSGYTFNAASNPNWTGAAPTVSRTIAQIDPGQSVKIQIVLKLVQTNGGSVNWDNYSEIVSAKDKNGVNATTWDADSNPGSDAAHERAVKPNDADDDNINGHYIPDGTDEDDHDPAGPKVFDLALKKVETSAGAYRYGDPVTFTYTVYNQGNIAAKDIEVMDYVPTGFKYVPALNPGWTPAVVSTPKKVIAGPLAPGASTTVTIILVAQPTTDIVDGWTNKAEIVKAKDPQGNDMSDKDLDSDLDNDPNNDVGGTPDTPEDDMVSDDGKDGDGDGVTDEDDADPARVKIYDLALTKKVVTPKPYTYYQDISFEIEVFNQGNEIMKNVVVNDYIPVGYTFSAASNPAWSGAAPTVSRTIAQIDPGQSVKIQIVLKLAQTNGGETHWDNYAEVASAQDKNGVNATTWDADSNPNSDSPHERAVKPGDADDDNINGHYVPDGTDEDDHDPAGVEVLDLALTKTANVQAPLQYDQIIDFVLTIYNQGNEIAHDIRLIDYVPQGYIYLPHLNPDWTQALTNRPETILPGTLAPGASVTKVIKLQFQYTPVVGGYVNKAEIRDAKDEQNNPFDDIDSDPDNNPNNDIGGTPNTPEDDNVDDDGKDGDGDGIRDEDDEDPWTVPVASIGNYVWYDNNDNGIQDDGLPSVVGVQGVLVILKDCAGNEVLRTTTDANGHYDFKNLIPGNYLVTFKDLPNNTIWAKQNIGNDALDSDPDANGLAICTNLAAGEDDPTWDAGILKLASLGDYVWLDTDNDGIQDPDESSVSGITVRLLDANGNIIQTTLTNEQGFYLFDSLRPGTYYVQFVKPNGLEFTLAGQGGDPNKDSNANPADGRTGGVILAAGDNRRDIDAGLKCTIDVQVSADVIVCQGESVTITSQVSGGAPPITYLWSNSGTGPNITVTPQSTTVYKLTVTDKYGCEDTDEAVVTVEPKAKIGDRVWMDIDRDGIQDYYIGDPDLDENGINGVTVNLYKASDPNTVFMTQVTHTYVDTTGYYEFEVCKGDYFVEFIPPTGSGYIFTLQDQGGNDVLDSDANPATGRTIATYLAPGEIDHTWDAGFYMTASLGDRVWHDIDADGIQDPNEPGIPGVGVTLRDGNGTVIATTTTNAQGYYEFTGLVPDDYYVCFDISGSGYDRVSPRNAGFNDAVDSDADPVTGCTEITTIVANENDLTWDLGLYNLASLGDYVWLDKDADGCQDAGETGIPGVVVRLYRDNDANGVPDGAQLAQTTTNGTGYYIFNNLVAGTYLVKFDKPSTTYKTSPKNNNNSCDDASDSDGDAIFGYSDPSTLTDNEHDPTIDQGYYQTAKIGDYVWYDIDGDGIQDPNEPGVPGVVVTLYKDTDGDGIPDTAVSTKVTNSGPDAGKYLFDNVDPGVYKICFDAANTQYEGFTKVDQGGNDATDSDASQTTGCTPVFTVQSGDDNRTFDAGLIKLAELGDFVWEDRNADGYQDPTELPIAGVKVELLDINGTVLGTKFTDGNGFYKFEDLYPGDYIVRFTKPSGFEPTTQNNPISDTKDSDANPVSGLSHIVNLEAGESDMTIDAGYYKPAKLGDYVWHDKDADGIQDPNENGINGIVVTLYDGAGNPVGNTTTGVNPVTGEDGYYIFDNLKPGTYYVCFDKGSYDKISPRDSGSNDAKDSDADPLSGCTIVTVLESGETDRTWDAGLYNLASLGDYVWLDTNVDGIQNPAEVGINGIVVNLYKDADKDGNPDGAPINTMTTVTNAGKDGYYIFDNLEPGDYVVMFAPSVAHSRTLSNAGSDDTKDSDANVTTGLTHSINLISGEHDPTIDAGYYYSASLGDYTWFDEDADGIQDVGEKCLDSVKIRLYKVNTDPLTGILDTVYVGFTYSHSVLDGADTLKCGFYEFKNLQPGKYFLVFENKNADVYTISPKERLFNRATDSNPNDKGNTATINLNPGEHNPTIDAGFYKGGCMEGEMWDENRTNPLNESCILDPLDYPLVNYRVDLIWDGNPGITTDDRLFKTDYTDAAGKYEFRNIPVGEYYLVIYLPADKTLTCADAEGDDKKDSDFYLSDETGQYRSHTFSITPNNDGDCKLDVMAGTEQRTFPIDIVLFEANWNETEDQVELEWQSMNEVNLSHFIVMRKGAFENRFIEIGTVEANGSLELNEYMLPDRNVEKANVYLYRLIPVDKDGTKNKYYDDEVRIPGNAMKVFAYPNPTKSLLNIEVLGKANDQLRIEILDNIGKRALNDVIIEKNNNIAEKVSIDVSNLPQGNYFIKVKSGNAVEVKRVAVIK